MKARLFFMLLIAAGTAVAQEKKQWQPFLMFDSYYSFIGNRSADVWGFRGGIVWNESWRFGAGYNKLRADIVERKSLPAGEVPYAKDDTVKAQLYLRYYPLLAEYIAYQQEAWQISIPLQLGYGSSYFEYFDRNNAGRRIFERGVLVFQPGVHAQYRVLKWFGLSAGIGYRLVPVNNPEIDAKMNSPVFTLGLKLFPGEIVKTIRGGE